MTWPMQFCVFSRDYLTVTTEDTTKAILTSSVSILGITAALELGLDSNFKLEEAPSKPLSRGLNPLPAM